MSYDISYQQQAIVGTFEPSLCSTSAMQASMEFFVALELHGNSRTYEVHYDCRGREYERRARGWSCYIGTMEQLNKRFEACAEDVEGGCIKLDKQKYTTGKQYLTRWKNRLSNAMSFVEFTQRAGSTLRLNLYQWKDNASGPLQEIALWVKTKEFAKAQGWLTQDERYFYVMNEEAFQCLGKLAYLYGALRSNHCLMAGVLTDLWRLNGYLPSQSPRVTKPANQMALF